MSWFNPFLTMPFPTNNAWAATSPWEQTTWEDGAGTGTVTEFESVTNINFETSGQITLNTNSNWFDADWSYRQSFAVDNSLNTNTLTEYQVLVTLDTASLISSGKMQSNCDDMRFTNEAGDSLSYDILNNSCNSTETKVWFKTDLLTASSSNTFYVYYGNGLASSDASMADTFSYSEAKTVGLIIDSRMASGDLNVISLEDGNSVSDGTTTLSLDEQGTSTFGSTELSVGTEIQATKLFHADSGLDGADMIAPISFAGTLFLHNAYRYDHSYQIYSPWADANVDVSLNGSSIYSGTISKYSAHTVTTGTVTNGNIRIESNVPVLVHHDTLSGSAHYDALVLYPATTEDLYGIPSNSFLAAAGTDGATVSWVKHDATSSGSPQTLSANGLYKSSTTGAQGTSGAFRISTTGSIGISQIADSDGGESVVFLPQNELGTKYGSAGGAQYITVAAPQTETTCTITDSTGNHPANPASGFSNPHTSGVDDSINTSSNVNFIYFGKSATTDYSWQSGGWMMECDKPVYAYYEYETGTSSEPSDEHNLWSYPQMRQFTYPTPSANTPASEETIYQTSGTLTSNILDSNTYGSLWGILSYTTSDATNTKVKVRTSASNSMLGATEFSSCTTVTSGSDISDNACVSDEDRYVQYQIALSSDGLSSPVFEDISLSYTETPAIVVQADAGEDQLLVVGKSLTLDGSASTGRDITYNWAIVNGEGSLTGTNTANPTFTSDADAEAQDVLIYLTVKDVQGKRSTDKVTLHLITTASGHDMTTAPTGIFNKTLIYETTETNVNNNEVLAIETNNTTILMPENTNDYVLANTSDNKLLVGFPDLDHGKGAVFLIDTSITLPESIDLSSKTLDTSVSQVSGNQDDSKFGSFIAAGDLDGNGEDDILVSAPGETSHGSVYIYDDSFNFTGVLIGSSDYPLDSIRASAMISADHDILFGPNNPSLHSNLSFASTDQTATASGIFIVLGSEDLEGVTILDNTVVDTLIADGVEIRSFLTDDLDGDGQDDLIISDDEGHVYVYFGKLASATDLNPSDADITIYGGSIESLFGQALAVGDVDGDGENDLLIGAPEYGESNTGAIHVILGTGSWPTTLNITSYATAMTIQGDSADAEIGRDLFLADSDKNGALEIYTVKNADQIFRVDLTGTLTSDEVTSTNTDTPDTDNAGLTTDSQTNSGDTQEKTQTQNTDSTDQTDRVNIGEAKAVGQGGCAFHPQAEVHTGQKSGIGLLFFILFLLWSFHFSFGHQANT